MNLILLFLLVISCTLLLGLAFLVDRNQPKLRQGTNVLVVLGSGGHTAEMLTLLQKWGGKEGRRRSYVVAATDKLSAQKAQRYEEALQQKTAATQRDSAGVTIHTIPRSREVGQSYLTSVWTTLVAVFAAFSIVLKSKPDLVLVNGPGTCIPICMAAVIFRRVYRWQGQIVYIESIARVASLSLSGKILYYLHIADLFLVQWPVLQLKNPRAKYCGRLY